MTGWFVEEGVVQRPNASEFADLLLIVLVLDSFHKSHSKIQFFFLQN